MPSQAVSTKSTAGAFGPSPVAAGQSLTVSPLAEQHRPEVLDFLAARPVHTVMLAGFARDNGLVSALNRGVFYGCRNAEGKLEGVALIGEITLVEANTEAALEGFARVAQGNSRGYVIVGEQEKIERFWHYYAGHGQAMRVYCRELLFELDRPAQVAQPVEGLRLATLADLEPVMNVHAELALAESGVDPREADPAGFRRRCARRIEQGRTWVLMEDGGLVFKADIASQTPEVVYLEGIYVAPGKRNKGYGVRCLSQLSRVLLERTRVVCLLVNEENPQAQALYRRTGFQPRGCYDTIFLQRPH